MKKNALVIAFSFLLATTWAQDVAGTKTLKNNMDSISYSLGVLIAQNFKNSEGLEIDANQMVKGFQDALGGKETIDVTKANQLISEFMESGKKKKFLSKIEEGRKFLEENGKRPGVKTTASGLQYEVMVDGTGPIPLATDKVTTHYHGTLLNGKVFDSSVERGQPIDFPVNGVIQGWQEALQLMKTGSKWKVYLPYNLAYGERGAGADIGPYEALIFEVELLKVN
jgi:FKBP-type peptidyl-prolyl cis-trans isomerase FklB